MGNLVRIWRDVISGELTDKKESLMSEPLDLVFDSETKLVYYKFSEKVYIKKNGGREITSKVGYMSPYIGKYGRHCQFIDNQIVEIL